MKWSRTRRGRLFLLVCGMAVLLLGGCGKKNGNTTLVLTTGFGKNEVFRIDSISCTLPEMMVYLTDTQNQYESIYGSEIWETRQNEVSLEDNVKETVLAKMAQVKTMNLLAEQYDVALSEEEIQKVHGAAAEYYSGLNDTEKESMGVSEDTIRTLYGEYALAEKVYDYLIKDINPEISDDEARIITVQHILIKTASLDGEGNLVPYSEKARKEAYLKAKDILRMAKSGDYEFETLIQKYSEDSVGTYSFGKGETDPAFEEAGFNLETGEISNIVESRYGYHIMKCLNTFNRDETDANKLKIMEQRKKEVFGEKYNEFVAGLTRNLNEELWDKVELIHDPDVTVKNFFDIYTQFF